MSFVLRILSFAAIGLLFTACTSYQYIPSHHYLNLHKKKGELVASVNVLPVGLQAGYSVSAHLFVFSTAYAKQTNSSSSILGSKEGSGRNSWIGSSKEINVGAGYSLSQGITVFEVMAGGGFGDMSFEHDIDNTAADYVFKMSSKKRNVFIEPVVGFLIKDYFEVGLFSRFNHVTFNSISSTPVANPVQEDAVFADNTRVSLVMFEPGIFLNAGWPRAKFNIQIGGSDEIHGPNIRNRDVLFRSGLTLTLR